MPRFPLVGKTPSKVSNIYVYLVFMKIYMHISRGSSLYSSNLVNLFILYSDSEIFKKMSKFFQSSIPSPPYA